MGFADLPSEIIHLILGYLINDRKSSLSLRAIDRRTYYISQPLVNQSVKLVSLRALSAFCEAYVHGVRQPPYSIYITELHVGSNWRVVNDGSGFRLPRDHVPYLRRALGNLENLKSLSLAVTSKTLTLLLNQLVVPFKLESFVHTGRFSGPLSQFLEGQPRITHLGWHGAAFEADVCSLCKLLQSNLTILPKLEALDGPILLLSVILPLRPISRITITQKGLTGSLESFIEALQRTTTPITRLCICEDDHRWPTWMKITRVAQSTCLPSTLKQLYIVELSNITRFEQSHREESAKLLSKAMTSPSFRALESFELTSTQGLRWYPPLPYVRSWLSRGGCGPSDWKIHVPLLRTVVVHDLEIVL